MKRFNGTIFRIVSTLILFGIFLTMLQILISFFVIRNMNDRLINSLLKAEVSSYLSLYVLNKNTVSHHSKYIRVFRELPDVPETMRDVVEKLEYGIYNPKDLNIKRLIHIAVIKLPDSDIPVYMLFDGKSFRLDNQKFLNPKYTLILILLFLLIPGILSGLYATHKIIGPIKDLIRKIKILDPEKFQDQLHEKGYDEEVGVLTKILEKTAKRINHLIKREKVFTRDASRELRKPLTLIQGAVEIIEAQPDSEKNSLTQRALKRIKRSVNEMKITIETFLFLTREDFDADETCDVNVSLAAALEQNKYLLDSKSVKINRIIKALPVIKAPQLAMLIVINNIIRNAFNYSHECVVTVTVSEDFLEITDTGIDIKIDRIEDVTKPYIKRIENEGFDIGLAVIERVCGRFNWKLDIKHVGNFGTTVRLTW